MKIYLVGGAVRDTLLNLRFKEKDWVVVGATVDDMLVKGYKQVGKDFPVFLHPETKEEYALARVERKVGKGYTGFTFDTSPKVTLEEDLKRRDLTINAIASDNGVLVDPYGGQQDIQKKVLRHVSAAFVEDPVRILRVARFAARFAHLGFTVADETNVLMQQMVKNGEVSALVAERVWKELETALAEKNPEVFFQVLQACDARSVLFPEIEETARLASVVSITQNTVIRFAALCATLSADQVNHLCERYRIPNEYRELAFLVSRYVSDYEKISSMSAQDILSVLTATDAFRREDRFKSFIQVCEICTKGFSNQWLACYDAAKQVNAKNFMHLQGKEIAMKIAEEREKVISDVINQGTMYG